VIGRFQEILAEEQRARRTSILLVEQNVSFALALADRYAVLKLGMIVETGYSRDTGSRETIERHLVI
jgi:branched-chain amino acid transport system ATP-binding protein